MDNYDRELRDFGDLMGAVRWWAAERNIIALNDNEGEPPYMFPPDGGTLLGQARKLLEEAREVLEAAALIDAYGTSPQALKDLTDGIGDVLVVLIIISAGQGITLGEALQKAWNDIKDRKGRMVNGVFVKETEEEKKEEPLVLGIVEPAIAGDPDTSDEKIVYINRDMLIDLPIGTKIIALPE